MGTFHFALQPALDAALMRERATAMRMSRDAAKLAALRAAQAGVEGARRIAFATLAWRSGTGSHALAGRAADFVLEGAAGARVRAAAAVAQAGVRAGETRAAHERARIERRALEHVRARRLAEHRAARDARESAELDESNARRSCAS